MSVTNTTAETTLYSVTLPANTLGTHHLVRVSMGGTYFDDSGVGRTIRLQIKYGATTLYDDTTAGAGDILRSLSIQDAIGGPLYGTSAVDSTVAQTLADGRAQRRGHEPHDLAADRDGSVSVHAPGGHELARSVVPGGRRTFRPQHYTRAPVGGVEPMPRNVDFGHPWCQWRPGQMKTKLHLPRSERA